MRMNKRINSHRSHRSSPAAGSSSSQRGAFAQSATDRRIQGVVTDADTGEPLLGVTVVATSPALQGTRRRSPTRTAVQHHQPAARQLRGHLLLRRRAGSGAATSTVGIGKVTAGLRQDRHRGRRRRGHRDHREGARRSTRLDHAGHHDRPGLHQEHPGPGPHVRVGARRRRRLAGRRLGVSFSGLDLAREPVLRRRRQHDRPDASARSARRSSTTSSRRSRSSPAATTPSSAARPAASSTSSPRAARTSSTARCSATCTPGLLTARPRAAPATPASIDARRQPRLRRRLRLRARRPDHQGQALVLRRLRAASQRDTITRIVRTRVDRSVKTRLRAPTATAPTATSRHRRRPPELRRRDGGLASRRRCRRRPDDRLLHLRGARAAREFDEHDAQYTVRSASSTSRSTPEHQGQLVGPSARRDVARGPSASSARRPRTDARRGSPPTCRSSGRRSSTTTRPRSRPSSAGTATTIDDDAARRRRSAPTATRSCVTAASQLTANTSAPVGRNPDEPERDDVARVLHRRRPGASPTRSRIDELPDRHGRTSSAARARSTTTTEQRFSAQARPSPSASRPPAPRDQGRRRRRGQPARQDRALFTGGAFLRRLRSATGTSSRRTAALRPRRRRRADRVRHRRPTRRRHRRRRPRVRRATTSRRPRRAGTQVTATRSTGRPTCATRGRSCRT